MSKFSVSTGAINALARKLHSQNVDLGDAAQDPDVNQFMAMLSQYAQNLFSGSKLFVFNPETRQDIAQNACMETLRRFRQFDPEQAEFSTLFHKICANARIREYKHGTRRKRTPEDGKILSLNWEEDGEGKSWARHIPDARQQTPVHESIHHEESERDRNLLSRLQGDRSPLTSAQKSSLQAVLEHGNLARAARALGVEGPAVRSAMKRVVETARQLAMPIFTRDEEHTLRAVIDGLSAPNQKDTVGFYKAILENRFFEFIPVSTHAAELGISYSCYHNLSAKAMRKLRNHLDALPDHEMSRRLLEKVNSFVHKSHDGDRSASR